MLLYALMEAVSRYCAVDVINKMVCNRHVPVRAQGVIVHGFAPVQQTH